ncbi:MAG: hypothetical protein LBU36_02900 [Clostridiales bacterium]|nr:hypothetical protein [Clostridiales bacterium]
MMEPLVVTIMNIPPNADKAVIPIEKLTKYALGPDAQPDKARAFELASGYNLINYNDLISEIYDNAGKFQDLSRGDKGFGETYQVITRITGLTVKPQICRRDGLSTARRAKRE